jgi:hypothetical protein
MDNLPTDDGISEPGKVTMTLLFSNFVSTAHDETWSFQQRDARPGLRRCTGVEMLSRRIAMLCSSVAQWSGSIMERSK